MYFTYTFRNQYCLNIFLRKKNRVFLKNILYYE